MEYKTYPREMKDAASRIQTTSMSTTKNSEQKRALLGIKNTN